MDVRSRQSIQEHLGKEDVQERILQNIQRGRDEATVTISRAAELFGITENKLRDWEEYGFLNPLRPSGPKGRRLYTPSELDKLAIIRELINAGYSASEIPADIDKQWHTIRELRERISNHETTSSLIPSLPPIDESINERLINARAELFWRYYVSRALRFSLKLLCDDIPNTTAGLLLPLHPLADSQHIHRVDDVAILGESVVGWLSQSGSSQTLLTPKPSFQYSSDFRIEPLCVKKAGINQEARIADKTLIVLQREASPLTLDQEIITTIRRLLQPIYEQVELTRACLDIGMCDVLDSATDLYTSINHEDVILNELAEMIITMGGKTEAGTNRWHSCWILIPRDQTQPLHITSLIPRAQNREASRHPRAIIPVPDRQLNNPYLRALRSHHIIYCPDITIAEPDNLIRSAIALPIAGEDGVAIGVMYIVSHISDAFTQDDQRILRVINRMLEEVLRVYTVRNRVTYKLTEIVKNPGVIDTLFERFAAENTFNRDVEDLLKLIHEQLNNIDTITNKHVSFIALDIDKQSSLANKYGDRLVRNLTHEVGLRVQEQIRSFFKEYPDCQLYHIHADRFYILLKNTSLEQAREHAEQLRLGTQGPYKVDALRTFADQQTRPESLMELHDISIRLGVTSYPYTKLAEILREHPLSQAVTEVRSIITSALDVALVKGQIEGGNVVVSWDYDIRNFVRWSPTRGK